VTPDATTQINNDSAVDVSAVNARLGNVIVLDLSVAADKTKTLRQKNILRTDHTAREIDPTSRRTFQYRHTTRGATRPMLSDAHHAIEADCCHLSHT
jgi:hypothetical protein